MLTLYDEFAGFGGSSQGAATVPGAEMCTPIHEPARTITTHGHQSLVGWRTDRAAVEQCTFRMLAPHEIAGMGFAPDYKVKGSNRDQVRGYGNAVTPPAAEVLISALVEAISGEPLNPSGVADRAGRCLATRGPGMVTPRCGAAVECTWRSRPTMQQSPARPITQPGDRATRAEEVHRERQVQHRMDAGHVEPDHRM